MIVPIMCAMDEEEAMQMIEYFYNLFVNRIPGIRDRYQRKRASAKGGKRYLTWLYLIYLNMAYYIFRNKEIGGIEKYPYYENKILYVEGSESAISKRIAPKIFARNLAVYDIISFDVFDTLIFRPFSSPTDLFYILGDKLNYLDFARIRQEMEWKAREKKYKKEKHYEVNLDEIYTVLSEETGIDKKIAMQWEIELENRYCFANPYMQEVIQELLKMNKRIIISSDMYLNTRQIQDLLKTCGYPLFAAYYVSCDKNASKNKGDLYAFIKRKEGNEKTYIHIGDNDVADIKQAKKHGLQTEYYPNVNHVGMQYRAEDMSVITGGIYRGLVNAHIHNGLQQYTKEYEYGYIYGGLFVTGYCQFIYRYVKKHKIDKLLFLARDGDILLKAYNKLYPKETESTQYVYWSRLAATKLSAKYYKYDYFRRFLYHKVNQQYSLKEIFLSMELEDMLSRFCEESKLTEETKLNDSNVDMVKKYFAEHWKEVWMHYEEQQLAGKQYYEEALQDAKSAIAIDIGWAGSGAITLDYLVNEEWALNCPITGIIAGTNTCHNTEPNASETFLQSGKLVSYLYSQRENRDIWKFHDPAKNHNLYWEMLLDAPTGSFKGFYLDTNGEYECQFKENPENIEGITEIQTGILDFVERYRNLQVNLEGIANISGRDAYAPMINAMSMENKEFMQCMSSVMDEMGIV